jgi:hypothetical protein
MLNFLPFLIFYQLTRICTHSLGTKPCPKKSLHYFQPENWPRKLRTFQYTENDPRYESNLATYIVTK